MRYISVCSGIEAATVAWHPLGWEAAWFSEIDKFPSDLLAYRYPNVPNLGDMTKFKDWPDDDAIDILVGGTPCQSFSVAGLRAGMADPRGNLALTYLAIADRYKPRWLAWENVPGVLSSNGGLDFGAILGGMVQLGYGVAYRVLDAQFCRTFGFAGAVPQRRRRVLVVGYLGDWRRAAAVLFDGASLRGDSPPGRRSRQAVAPTLSARTKGGGGLGSDFEIDGGLVPDAAHSLRADGFDASEDGTGRGTPLIPEVSPAMKARDSKGVSSDGDGDGLPVIPVPPDPVSFDWQAGGGGNDASFRGKSRAYIVDKPGAVRAHIANRVSAVAIPPAPVIAFGSKNAALDHTEEVSPTLRSGNEIDSHASGGVPPAVAFQTRFARNDRGAPDVVASALTAEAGRTGKGDSAQAVAYLNNGWRVRRLTPRECERLQGFPNDYTQIPRGNKPTADGPRYKALGSSMAVNVMRVLGQRIDLIDKL